jgi:hypothetical protein
MISKNKHGITNLLSDGSVHDNIVSYINGPTHYTTMMLVYFSVYRSSSYKPIARDMMNDLFKIALLGHEPQLSVIIPEEFKYGGICI